MSDSDEIRALRVMENGWRSKRLVYRAVEDNEEDRKYCYETLHNDPIILGQAYPEVYFKPQSRAMSADLFALWPKDKLLAVLICLPGTSTEIVTESDEQRARAEAFKTQKALRPLELVPVGSVTLTREATESQHHRNTALGITIAAPYRGRGYGSEAISWAVDWAFDIAGLHRVTLTATGFNIGAQRLYERLGFVKEGVQRESVWFNRRWWDTVLYGMLESDWSKLRGISQS